MEVHPGMDTPFHVNGDVPTNTSASQYLSGAAAFVGAVAAGEGLAEGNIETAVFRRNVVW
jgi:hypothetical protein